MIKVISFSHVFEQLSVDQRGYFQIIDSLHMFISFRDRVVMTATTTKIITLITMMLLMISMCKFGAHFMLRGGNRLVFGFH